MKKIAQVGLLCSILNCEAEEITKISTTVYQWRGITYEVTGKNKITAPASHYSFIEWANKTWALRELGEKSQIIKQMKGRHAKDN